MTPLFGKSCFSFLKKLFFDMGEKVGFTNCVFEKVCFSENTIFIVFSAKHSFSKTKIVWWKNRKFMKNSGLFLNMENCVFGFLFFWGFILIVVCFCVSTIKVLKMLVFPSFWVFFWVGFFFFIWVWKVCMF